MADSPTFSVIVPVYNRESEVRDLCESLLRQTSGDFELILVEDGSSAPCKNVADDAAARGLNVRYFYKENEGRSIARNYGIERARGRWLVFFSRLLRGRRTRT